jgi:hypothetical protein
MVFPGAFTLLPVGRLKLSPASRVTLAPVDCTVAAPLNALLAPLGNYGGPTQTMALLPGSPAIDAGNNAFIPSDLTDENNNNDVNEPAPFDLDGNSRLVGATVDLGAYEWQGAPIPPKRTYLALVSR